MFFSCRFEKINPEEFLERNEFISNLKHDNVSLSDVEKDELRTLAKSKLINHKVYFFFNLDAPLLHFGLDRLSLLR